MTPASPLLPLTVTAAMVMTSVDPNMMTLASLTRTPCTSAPVAKEPHPCLVTSARLVNVKSTPLAQTSARRIHASVKTRWMSVGRPSLLSASSMPIPSTRALARVLIPFQATSARPVNARRLLLVPSARRIHASARTRRISAARPSLPSASSMRTPSTHALARVLILFPATSASLANV
ncbi:hypothetical protein BKA57DRAFT_472311 [Linnemannia elongata]|nr:hypothetical protein BKA57DRAFT_472311 [Linnemannia elongata]